MSRGKGEGGRAYPHDLDAERAVLGSVVIDNAVLRSLAGVVDDVDFYLERHRRIYGRMVALQKAGVAVDPVTLAETFRRDGQLEDAGGVAYLSALTDSVPMSTSAPHYAGIVRSKADQRRAIQIAEEVPAKVGEAEDPAALMVSAGRRLVALGRGAGMESRWVWASEIAQRAFESIDGHGREQSAGVQMVKIDCGIPLLETYTTELRLIGARTSVGKTALAHQLVLGAGQAGVGSGFITMETMASQLGLRGLGCLGRVDVKRMVRLLNQPELTPRESEEMESGWRRLARAAELYHSLPVAYYDQGQVSVDQIAALVEHGREQYGMLYFCVDYAQMLKPVPHMRSEKRHEQLSHAGTELKGICKELGVAIDLLVQIKPEVDQRADKRPQLGDVKDCSTLVDRADCVVMLHREGYYALNRKKSGGLPGQPPPTEADLPIEIRRHAEAGIVKDRNHGRAGRTVELSWFSEYQRFERLAHSWEDGRE